MLDVLYNRLKHCNLCPHECNTNRYLAVGVCSASADLVIASYGAIYHEENIISGTLGSGSILFSSCNLLCEFCNEFKYSHLSEGKFSNANELADLMLQLQSSGCHNINLQSPTHYTPQIVNAIILAKNNGLTLPIIWNSNAYEKVDTLRLLSGLVDIYLPDVKFFYSEKSEIYTISTDYFDYASKAVAEMYRQVGDLEVENGIAKRGLLVRHLVLPNNQADTREIIDFVSNNIGKNTAFNLMSNYIPTFHAEMYHQINQKLTKSEFEYYIEYAKQSGLKRLYLSN